MLGFDVMGPKLPRDLPSTLKEIANDRLDVEQLRASVQQAALLAAKVERAVCELRNDGDIDPADIVESLRPLHAEVRRAFHASKTEPLRITTNALELMLTEKEMADLSRRELDKHLYWTEHLAAISSRWLNDLAELLPSRSFS